MLEDIVQKKRISVMINTYNRINELKECLNSIFMQTYTDYEIIIIDDNSSDGTEDFCKEIYDPRVKYFRNSENKGQAYGKKKYFGEVTGEYIIFCDDDDYYLLDTFFQKVVDAFESDEKINCICANSLIKYEGEDKCVYDKLNIKNKISAYKYLEKFQIELKKPNSTFSAAFKRKVLEDNGLLDMFMINDSSIYLRSLISGGKVYVIEEIVGIYRIHSSNVTKNLKIDFILDNLEEKKSIADFIKEHIKQIDSDEWLEKQVSFTVYYYLTNSKYSKYDLNRLKDWCTDNIEKKRYKVLFKFYKILVKKKIMERN